MNLEEKIKSILLRGLGGELAGGSKKKKLPVTKISPPHKSKSISERAFKPCKTKGYIRVPVTKYVCRLNGDPNGEREPKHKSKHKSKSGLKKKKVLPRALIEYQELLKIVKQQVKQSHPGLTPGQITSIAREEIRTSKKKPKQNNELIDVEDIYRNLY